jgi:hypothetical protein
MELVLETRQRDEHSCCAAGASLSDLHADVCSQPDTHPALMGISKAILSVLLVRRFPHNASTILQIFRQSAVIRHEARWGTTWETAIGGANPLLRRLF